MAALIFPASIHIRKMSLVQIDAVVSARLGVTRGRSKSQPLVFNRQVAMYLANRVGNWSTTAIGRFYNGRDHSTVCHAIQKIELLRKSNSDVEILIAELERELHARRLAGQAVANNFPPIGSPLREAELELVARLLAEKVWVRLGDKLKVLLDCVQPSRANEVELALPAVGNKVDFRNEL